MSRDVPVPYAVKPSARSAWHLVDFENEVARQLFCGRIASLHAPMRAELPGDERTCERCAVIASKRSSESAHVAFHLAQMDTP